MGKEKTLWICVGTCKHQRVVAAAWHRRRHEWLETAMVSQRQRLARKRYKAEHPELFPKPEPTPPKDPNKKNKKKTSAFKRKRPDSKPGSTRRHPLRVPGMKPGESCFICKAKDHIAKLCPEKAEYEKNKVSLNV